MQAINDVSAVEGKNGSEDERQWHGYHEDRRIHKREKSGFCLVPESEIDVLHRLEGCPSLRASVARIHIPLDEIQSLLEYWKSLGRPHPIRLRVHLKHQEASEMDRRLLDFSWYMYNWEKFWIGAI